MKSIEILERLIAFDTTSRNSNLELIQFIEEYLKKFGISSRLSYDETRTKANLFATIPGKSDQGGLILSGHTDVVPVDGQAWETKPFKATSKDGKIYGRGTADMKGFIAVVLALVPQFVELFLEEPLFLAFSYDEEVGCLGARILIDDITKSSIHPTFCIVGEPTKCEPIVAHKGIQVFRCRVHGRATHSSLTPEGCNAVEYAAQFITWLKKYAEQLKNRLTDIHFDVPYTTLTSNIIQGGTAVNIIPNVCEVDFEFRQLPNDSAEAIQKDIQNYIDTTLIPLMKKDFENANVELIELGANPSFEAKPDETMVELLKEITNVSKIKKVSYATEAGLFQKAKISTVICGPGSIEQAHRPNEFIAIDELERYEKILLSFVKQFNKKA
jgi:acetylornithine deacetylase